METLGTILIVCGALTGLASHIAMLLAAHEHGPGWVLWCFFVPVVLWFLIVTNFRRFWKPAAVQVAGISLLLTGCALM